MAISASSYSVGNRVYRGGSSAPTQGTVDPSGYIERELSNVASQSRSGLASAALRRLKGPQSPAERAGVETQPRVDRKFGGQGPALPNRGVVAGGMPGGFGAAPPTPVPRLNMSETGKLNIPDVRASMGGTSLPYDPDAADAQQQLLAQKNRFEQMINDAQYGLERDYATRTRTVQDEIPDSQRQLLENYAGRGLAYSSGYTHDYGDLSSQYANLLAELQQGKTEGVANLLRQRGMFNEEYYTALQGIQAAAARRLADKAGDLGLGGEAPGGQDILDSLFGRQPAPTPTPAPVPSGTGGILDGPFKRFTPVTAPAPAPAPAPVPAGTGGIFGGTFKRFSPTPTRDTTTSTPTASTTSGVASRRRRR